MTSVCPFVAGFSGKNAIHKPDSQTTWTERSSPRRSRRSRNLRWIDHSQESLPRSLRSVLHPGAQVLVSLVLEPEIKRVPCGNLAAPLGPIAAHVLDLADVDPEQAVTPLLARLNLVLHPLARARVLSDQDNGDGRPLQLSVDPRFDCGVAFLLHFLELSCVDEPRFLDAFRHARLFERRSP